jgi:hypothetical protein
MSGQPASAGRTVSRPLRWIVAGAIALTCTFASAQTRYGLSPEAFAVFNRWVTTTCVGDEARALIEEMRRFREPLGVAFRKAITDGPTAEELRVARAAASERYDARAKFPMPSAIEGVNEKGMAAFGRVSRQAYVDDQVQRFATGYRANAIAGVGIVGGPGSREALSRLAGGRNVPLALAAREALKTMDTQ